MRSKISGSRGSVRRRGFVLVSMALTAVGVFSVVGMAIDASRLLIAKNETQVFCDSAAVAASAALDGTLAGIARAGNAAAASPNKWNFDTLGISSPVVRFATA